MHGGEVQLRRRHHLWKQVRRRWKAGWCRHDAGLALVVNYTLVTVYGIEIRRRGHL